LRTFNATTHFSNMTGKWQAAFDRRGSGLLTFQSGRLSIEAAQINRARS
jgi:multimeric flavodoxin WrbA